MDPFRKKVFYIRRFVFVRRETVALGCVAVAAIAGANAAASVRPAQELRKL